MQYAWQGRCDLTHHPQAGTRSPGRVAR